MLVAAESRKQDMSSSSKEKLVLKKVYDGMAVTGYEDQHGCSYRATSSS